MKTHVLPFLFSAIACVGVLSSAPACAKPKPQVLVALSGVDYVTLKEGTKHATGFFLSELATPARALAAAGYELVFATPTGKEAAMDKGSDGDQFFASPDERAQAKAFLASLEQFKKPLTLSSLDAKALARFRGIFIPGGHAPMEDLAKDKDLGRILRYFHDAGKPTALICHGPAALLSAKEGDAWPYKGYKLTVFSNAEEKIGEDSGNLGGHVMYYPEDALAAAGAVIQNNAQPWQSNAVRDRELITAQNPMSDHAFADLFLKALAEATPAR